MSRVLAAMAREWGVYREFKATGELTQAELDSLYKRSPKLRIVDTRWVVVRKGTDFKARLVVIGCQEPRWECERTALPEAILC